MQCQDLPKRGLPFVLNRFKQGRCLLVNGFFDQIYTGCLLYSIVEIEGAVKVSEKELLQV